MFCELSNRSTRALHKATKHNARITRWGSKGGYAAVTASNWLRNESSTFFFSMRYARARSAFGLLVLAGRAADMLQPQTMGFRNLSGINLGGGDCKWRGE
eukprot:EG_transcript_30189